MKIKRDHDLASKPAYTNLMTNGQSHTSCGVTATVVEGIEKHVREACCEPVTVEGIILSVRRCTHEEIVFRMEVNTCVSEALPFRVYVRAQRTDIITDPVFGEVWRVHGIYQADQYFQEIINPLSCEKIIPTGPNLFCFLSNYHGFYRIGPKIANRLRKKVHDIEAVLNTGDIKSLIERDKGGLNLKTALNILEVWNEYTSELKLLIEFKKLCLPVHLAPLAFEIWGLLTLEKLKDDPYRLLAILEWAELDKIASEVFLVGPRDSRRQAAAIEQVCYLRYDAGHTAITYELMSKKLTELLGYECSLDDVNYEFWSDRICYFMEDNLIQLAGAYTLEHYIETEVRSRLSQVQTLNEINLDTLNKFEKRKTDYLRSIGTIQSDQTFTLNNEQKIIINEVINSNFYVIFGGTGTGKKIVLEAIFYLISYKWKIFPMTLTGLAAKVLEERTGHQAQTIAGFLASASKKQVPDNAWLFIDQASMLDLPTTYRLLKHLPPTVRICFIGDSSLLPPVGPGLILHPMYMSRVIPQQELKEVHHLATDTGIPALASEIREAIRGNASCISIEFDDFAGLKVKDCGASFISISNDAEIERTALRVYNEFSLAGQVQIIAASKNICNKLNAVIAQDHLLAREYKKLPCPSVQLPVIGKQVLKQKATIGDPIIWRGRNDHKRILYNGTLGDIIFVYSPPIIGLDTYGRRTKFVVKANFDGNETFLTEQDLENVVLGYVVTCHKSRGSKYERVIVVLGRSTAYDFIDNTWLYTAVTRAERQVVIVGDRAFFDMKITKPSNVSQRRVGIRFEVDDPTQHKSGLIES